MIDIVLAAGYATRMYPLTENFPKPLLRVGQRTILDRMIEDIDNLEDVERHIIVSNHKFAPVFEEWKRSHEAKTAPQGAYIFRKPVDIIDDGSVDNDHRIGAVKDLLLAIDMLDKESETAFSGDLMVMAADNVLDFSFRTYVEAFRTADSSMVMCYEELTDAIRRCGVVCLDDVPSWPRQVLSMEEKPQQPKSRWVVPPFYIYHRRDLELIRHSVENGCGFDAPGNLVHYMCLHTPMKAFRMPGKRYDIGNLETYARMKDVEIAVG